MNESIRNLLNALEELNTWLTAKQTKVKLTVIGRFAFYLARMEELSTTDIDTVNALEEEVFKKIQEIGIAHGMKLEWLNDNSKGLSLPENFESRLIQKKKIFSNIEIKYASRFDLICLKAAAYVSRGFDDPKDFQDLLLLKPNNSEIEEAITFIKKYHSPPHAKFFQDFEDRLNELRSITNN